MQLSHEQTQKLLYHLLPKIGGGRCSVCGKEQFSVSNTLFAAPTLTPSGLQLALVAVTCQACQHTLFFNAVGLGLGEKPKEEEEKKEGEEASPTSPPPQAG